MELIQIILSNNVILLVLFQVQIIIDGAGIDTISAVGQISHSYIDLSN